ncbi:MAG: Dolichyl-phosphate-mannose-protein mannosyltransferase [Microgenomates group bacterium ADurb.Bin219]|nr:MAG: Dolichyl-phosphate-mannose-protein mannosyltransferase [Microgenomates group bacterium ADurb.Bin219]
MKRKFLVILIFLLALFLRTYKLGSYPVSLTWDEAALGYNAYSILKTGKDEYGNVLPLIFKSFGDYKPGLYVYLAVPFVWLIGLNELAVRFPSALLGSLLAIVGYCLAKRLTSSERFGIIFSILLAINPWLIHFSRGAWEANVTVFEIFLAFYLFINGIKNKNNLLLFFSSVLFGLTFITYQGAKVFTWLVVFGLVAIWRREMPKLSTRKIFLLALPLVASFLVVSWGLVAGETAGRLKVMSVFSYSRPIEVIQQIKKEGGVSESLFFPLFHSEGLSFLRGILGRYFNHLSAKFLFFEGDWSSRRHNTTYFGMMYLASLPFLILGLIITLGRKPKKHDYLFLFWLLMAPVPAAITRDSIQGVRSLPMAVPLVYFEAVGLTVVLEASIKFKKIRTLLYLFLISGYLFNIIMYLDLYYIHFPINSAKDWLYGYKDMVGYVAKVQENYQKVVITQKYGQPYIYYLFYNRYPPEMYQKQAYLKENPYGDVGEIEKIDKVEFRNIYWPADRGISKSLFVGNEFELPLHDLVDQEKFQILKEVKFPDGGLAFRIVETR